MSDQYSSTVNSLNFLADLMKNQNSNPKQPSLTPRKQENVLKEKEKQGNVSRVTISTKKVENASPTYPSVNVSSCSLDDCDFNNNFSPMDGSDSDDEMDPCKNFLVL